MGHRASTIVDFFFYLNLFYRARLVAVWETYPLLNLFFFLGSSSHSSRVPDERFLRICLNGITHTCMIHRWNEENKPHRNKDVVAMYCGHGFFKLGSKVKI